MRPIHLLWKAENKKNATEEIAWVENEIASCVDFEIPELNLSIGYTPLWSMMDGKL